MKITVIGTGSWGTSLAQVLCDNEHDVMLYGINQDEVNDINEGYNKTFFNNLRLHPNLKATTDLEKALDKVQMIVLVVPTKVIKVTLEKIKPFLNEEMPVYFVNASKGFDPNTNDRMSMTIRKTIPSKYRYEVASIIGPSHAEEVIQRMYTSIASVSLDYDVARVVQETFSNQYLRLYTLSDEVGAEYGVALKNVFALCSGIVAGIGLGDNSRAALLTRGLNEMIKYGMSKGAHIETFLGLTGIGDLIVTATSVHSRNYQAGYKIGKEGNANSVINDEKTTIEGVRTCKVVYDDIQKSGIEMPIITECYRVLFEELNPQTAIKNLMSRELKSE